MSLLLLLIWATFSVFPEAKEIHVEEAGGLECGWRECVWVHEGGNGDKDCLGVRIGESAPAPGVVAEGVKQQALG